MITSDYLEQKVNFDEPILLVGPGIRSEPGNLGINPPMDIALIWFAERLTGKKGRLDVLDLPRFCGINCLHDLDAVKNYVEHLSSQAELGQINYLEGNILVRQFPSDEYDFIWDHGTLAGWSGCTTNTDFLNAEKIQSILKIYQQILHPGGKAALCCYPGQTKFKELCQKSYPCEHINLQRDAYQTNLKQEQFAFDSLRGSFLLRGGLLVPKYKYHLILEMRKSEK